MEQSTKSKEEKVCAVDADKLFKEIRRKSKGRSEEVKEFADELIADLYSYRVYMRKE